MSARYPTRKLSPRQAAKVAEFNRRLASGEFARAHYPCAACGRDDPEPLFANDRYGIAQATVICRRCGLLYLDPRPTREEQDRFYDGDAYRLLYEPEAQSPADLAQPYLASFAAARQYRPAPFDPGPLPHPGLPAHHRVPFAAACEVGAGAGVKLLPLMALGKRAFGVEPSPAMVALAASQGVELRQGSLEAVWERPDLLLLNHVLEHVFDPLEFLRRAVALGPRHVLVEVPGLARKIPSRQNAHNFYFSEDTLQTLAARAGLRCLAAQSFPENDFLVALFAVDPAAPPHGYDRAAEYRRVRGLARSLARRYRLRRLLVRLGRPAWAKRIPLNPPPPPSPPPAAPPATR